MPTVTFHKNGATFTGEVKPDSNLVVRAGVKQFPFPHLRYGCGMGKCTRCACRVLAGGEHLPAPNWKEQQKLGDERLAAGDRLVCQLWITHDIELEQAMAGAAKAEKSGVVATEAEPETERVPMPEVQAQPVPLPEVQAQPVPMPEAQPQSVPAPEPRVQITFVTNNAQVVSAPAGSNLLRVSLREKGGIPFRCGGGLCGTCKCLVEAGLEHTDAIKPKERRHLTKEQFAQGWRMACQTFVHGDVSVSWVPLAQRKAAAATG